MFRLWTTDSYQPCRVFAGHYSDVTAILFHPNSNYIATGSADRSVRVWDCVSGSCVRLMTGHKVNIVSISSVLLSDQREACFNLIDPFMFIPGNRTCTSIFKLRTIPYIWRRRYKNINLGSSKRRISHNLGPTHGVHLHFNVQPRRFTASVGWIGLLCSPMGFP